jgi:putative glutamine amidotransferase
MFQQSVSVKKTDIVKPFRTHDKYIIGIVGYKIGENTIGVSIPYYAFFSKYGEVKIIPPLNREVDLDIDLLVIPGGPDIDPLRYNARPHLFTGKPDILREWFDVNILPKYIENKIPVFGICRGHQSLAVLFGASLVQHVEHPTNEVDKRDVLVHNVHYNLNNDDFGITSVNSIHHQIVKNIPEGAVLIAFADTHKFKGSKLINYNRSTCDIEALYYPEFNCASVQWHPEELDSDIITESLINLLLN